MTDHLIERLWEAAYDERWADTLEIEVSKRTVIAAASALSSQSLSLSEAREEIERLKGLVAGIRECPQEPWQDIATAPKDGTYILVTNEAAQVSWVAKFVGERAFIENPWMSMMLNHWHSPVRYHSTIPTHWIPLPLPPSALENGPAGLADANNKSPDSDLSSLRKGAEAAARILDAEADFARENLEAITDDEAAHPGNNVPVRTVWRDRKVIAERCAAAIRALVSGSREDGA